jgi:hypothetical protein
MPAILSTWQAKIGRIFGSELAQKNNFQDPISEITRTGDVAQVVEYLLYKQEALELKPPVLAKKKKKKKLQNSQFLPPKFFFGETSILFS